jgi:hypothetical protein
MEICRPFPFVPDNILDKANELFDIELAKG